MQILPVYTSFLAAILNFVMISMTLSRISVDCTIVFPSLENIGFAVGIASISQLYAKLQVLPVYGGWMAAILNFLLISMSGISGGCTIVFPTFETIDIAVRIVSISRFLAKLKVLPFMAVLWPPS